MGRKQGTPVYPNKSEAGSYWITSTARRMLRRASKRSGKSESDIIEYCLRKPVAADDISKTTFQAEG
jgi:hypothetical protein